MNANHKPVISVEDMEIGRVYAEAAYAAAKAKGTEGELADELDAIVGELLDKDRKLDTFFLVASISRDQRSRLLETAFKDRVDEGTYRLLATLNHHDRLGVLRAVAAQVRKLVGDAAGVVKATVTSASALSSEQVGRLEKMLQTGLKAKPQLEFRVDPSVLGGIRIAVGETVYDDTVQSNLGRLREGILTRSSHEVQSR
jgi:F-type H+-transporting ATPase subunit delta